MRQLEVLGAGNSKLRECKNEEDEQSNKGTKVFNDPNGLWVFSQNQFS